MARKACAPYGARHVFFINAQLNSKTFRTKRSLEEFYFFETSLSLWLRLAIWVTKYEMLFERSEFIECFEKIGFRPLSSGRFCTFLCFVSFSDERNERMVNNLINKSIAFGVRKLCFWWVKAMVSRGETYAFVFGPWACRRASSRRMARSRAGFT